MTLRGRWRGIPPAAPVLRPATGRRLVLAGRTPSVQPEFPRRHLQFRRPDQLGVRDLHGVQRPFQLLSPEGQEPVEHGTGSESPEKDESLDQFLRTRKLQISVLQKMLEQIPLEKPGEDMNETDNPKKNQNQEP